MIDKRNDQALEAAEAAWRASVSATCKLMLRDAIRAYIAALPLPDGLEVIAWASPDALRKLAGRSPTVVEPSEFEDATTALVRLFDAQAAIRQIGG